MQLRNLSPRVILEESADRSSPDTSRDSAWLGLAGQLGTHADVDVAGHVRVDRTLFVCSVNIEGGMYIIMDMIRAHFAPG